MLHSRQTKIVATIGPSSSARRVLERMIEAGMNVARINFSHGSTEEHKKEIATIRAAADRLGRPIAILQDLCGPKIRIGEFTDGHIELRNGDHFTVTTRKLVGTKKVVSVNFRALPRHIRPNERILLEDGKFELLVRRVRDENIETEVIRGGVIRSRRGVNVPDTNIHLDVLPAKDKRDLNFGLAVGVDYFALSFVQNEHDILRLRKRIQAAKSSANIIAKIETKAAMEKIHEIIAVADGVMIARGDLAVEIPKEDVPLAQKEIIRIANREGKLSITATQMLDSMTTHPIPTRAEVNDVANAIFDGTDAVMLSGESAVGIDPVHAIATMAAIAEHTECSYLYREAMERRNLHVLGAVDAVTTSVARIATQTGAKAIIALTESGFTVQMVARHRPLTPILALTPWETTARQLSLVFGCTPIKHRPFHHTTDLIRASRKMLLKRRMVHVGDTFVIVLGIPFGHRGSTNSILVQKA